MEQTLPKLLRKIAHDYPNTVAQYEKNGDGIFEAISFSDYYQSALDFGAGLCAISIRRYDHIGFISDNRAQWAHADMGLLLIGAIDIPRGCDTSEQDLIYILSFVECKTVILENGSQLQRIIAARNSLPLVSLCIVFDPPEKSELNAAKQAGIQVFSFDEILLLGKKYRNEHPNYVEEELEKGTADELATIIFTSGTTGEPKGVMLKHENFLAQLDELPERIILFPGEKALCVLPIWHSFERMCEYVILNAACAVCYSKPLGSVLLPDFQALHPQLLPAVPRVFEAIYEGIFRTMRKKGGITRALFTFFLSTALLFYKTDRIVRDTGARFRKRDPLVVLLLVLPWLLLFPLKNLGDLLVFKKIRAKLGNKFRGGISGGGALPPVVDEFFWAVGVTIVEGYGLTETAPVISVRPFNKPIFGTLGSPIRNVSVKIIGENGETLPAGQKGVVYVKGKTVMKGYYKKPALTASIIDENGWLNTGDLGMFTLSGELVLRGRKKDTIVLRGGENVEPLPIEMRLNESYYIAQSVVLGQNHENVDQRYLVALLVPNQEEVQRFAQKNAIPFSSYHDLLRNVHVYALFDAEVKNLVNAKSGFKMYERISKFCLLEKPFEVGLALSAKQEIMRYKVPSLYKKELKMLYTGSN